MQCRYHSLYQECLKDLDPYLKDRITEKEFIIKTDPVRWPPLKGIGSIIRRFRSGKIRILYAISSETPDLWGEETPAVREIYFLYVGLRGDKFYDVATKILQKENII